MLVRVTREFDMEQIKAKLEITQDALYLSDIDSLRLRKRIVIENIKYLIVNDQTLTIIDAHNNTFLNETMIETDQ